MIATDHRLADLAAPIRVLARAFHHSAPARIPSQIDHRRKGDVHAVVARFGCGKLRTVLYELQIERARHSKRHGINRSVPVNHVEHKRERVGDSFFAARLANRLHRFTVRRIQNCARTPKRLAVYPAQIAQPRYHRFRTFVEFIHGILRQLQRFLFEAHRRY